MQFTSTSAVKLFEAIDHAMGVAGGGKYRAFLLVTELKKIGLEIRAVELPAEVRDPELTDC